MNKAWRFTPLFQDASDQIFFTDISLGNVLDRHSGFFSKCLCLFANTLP